MTPLDPDYFNVDNDKINKNIVLNNTLLYNKINDANITANISNTNTIGVTDNIINNQGHNNSQSDDNFF